MRKLITFIAIVITTTSCSVNNTEEGLVHVDLEGAWILDEVSCYCDFKPDTDFTSKRISFSGSTLIVTNPEAFQLFVQDGKYNYNVDGNLITLANGKQYRYQQKEQQLRLSFVDNPEIDDDELTLIYYKK